MSYQTEQRTKAAAWKATTRDLREEARADGTYRRGTRTYPFCLPREYGALTLLPEVRATLPSLFSNLGIAWHDSVDGGPSNHLLSSQVQCANALGQMLNDPARLVRAFGKTLSIEEVLPIEGRQFLTFEYIGPEDVFGESPQRLRVRGAGCTSVDAAFLHRSTRGHRELVLVEWKYTEDYRRVRSVQPTQDQVRRTRYEQSFHAIEGPVRDDVLTFEEILDEPFYQLVRQQLFAHELERRQVLGATQVRVAHVLPAGNLAYQKSLVRAGHKNAGRTVSEVWQKMLRRPDQFVQLDNSIFLDPQVTSDEYIARYG